MKKRLIGICLVVGMMFGLVPERATAAYVTLGEDLTTSGYKQIAHKRDVKVFKDSKSKTIRIAAEGIINAPAAAILQALLDYENQLGKLDRLSESKIIKHEEKQILVYQRLNLPVISDRDFTLRVKWWRRNGTIFVNYRALQTQGPKPRKGIVRVSNHNGTWQLKELPGCQRSIVRFQVEIDLAGWLPRWMAKSGAGKELPDLFRSVETMATKNPQAQRRVACTTK